MDNNLVQDGNNLGVLAALNKLSYYNIPPISTGLGGAGATAYNHSRFTHNTVINPLTSDLFWSNGFVYSEGNSTGRYIADNIFEIGSISGAASWTGGGGCLSFDGHWTNRSLKNNLAIQVGQHRDNAAPSYYDTVDCRSWAFPWKRSGTGVWQPVYSASIAGGVLTIQFGPTNDGYYGHGLTSRDQDQVGGLDSLRVERDLHRSAPAVCHRQPDATVLPEHAVPADSGDGSRYSRDG